MVDSEFRTYEYIRRVLGDLGWNTRNPARMGGGGGSLHSRGGQKARRGALQWAW